MVDREILIAELSLITQPRSVSSSTSGCIEYNIAAEQVVDSQPASFVILLAYNQATNE